MKKCGYAIAALAAIAVAAPTMASAETVIIKRGHDHDWDRGRAEYRVHRDYGLHEGWRHRGDRMVIVRHRHGYEY